MKNFILGVVFALVLAAVAEKSDWHKMAAHPCPPAQVVEFPDFTKLLDNRAELLAKLACGVELNRCLKVLETEFTEGKR